MRLMNTRRIGFSLSVLVIGLAPIAMASPVCNVRVKIPATAHTYAKMSEQSSWREYRSMQEVPDLKLDSGMSAQFWQNEKQKNWSVYMVEPGQDFWIYTRYCFDSGGELEGVDFEIRTLLGWGHRAEGTVSSYGFDANTFEYFSLQNGKVIPKPPGVGHIPAELKPILYREVTELPFASLLADSSKQVSKRGSAPKLASAEN
jgi:hypothetical protein